MIITNVPTLRKNLSKSINSVINYDEVITVNTKKGNAIILSENTYNSLLETLFLQSTPEIIKKIKSGENESIESMTVYSIDKGW